MGEPYASAHSWRLNSNVWARRWAFVTLEVTFFGSAVGSFGGVGSLYRPLSALDIEQWFQKTHTSAAVSQSSSHASAAVFVLLMKGGKSPNKSSPMVAVCMRLC